MAYSNSFSNPNNIFSDEDIFAWFRLEKVEPKVRPPPQLMTTTTRATLARYEREQAERTKDKSYYDIVSDLAKSKAENETETDDEDDLIEDDRFLTCDQDDEFEYPVPTCTSVFDSYDLSINLNPELPILEHRDAIINTIESNSVTIIQGVTGSGKSTQVPQYILDKYAKQRRYCNIICTQPRRIAATSIAKFVAEKRQWRLGSLIGYQIAMDKLVSEDTRLTFVTTGVFLQKLIKMQNMNQYTHIILDEVSITVWYDRV